MSTDQTCPRCAQPRPQDFPQCACGYNFVSGEVEPRTVDEERFLASFNIQPPPAKEPGSFALGLALGVVLGVVALVGAQLMRAQDDTRRGVAVGVVLQFVVAFGSWIALR